METLRFEKYNSKTKVWGVLVFFPFRVEEESGEVRTAYRATMMFHRNKQIAEAYVFGDKATRKHFDLCVTGDSSPNNLYWAYEKLQEVFLDKLPSGSHVEFVVPNPKLAAVYKRRIKFACIEKEYRGSACVFKIFKR